MNNYKIVKVANWAAAKDWYQQTLFAKAWTYRGLKSAKFSLQTSLERCNDMSTANGTIELELINRFRSNPSHYHEIGRIEQDDFITIISHMQHYGAPTRFLDTTKSFFIAAYFAFDELSDDSSDDCAIWAFNESSLRVEALDRIGKLAFGKRNPQFLKNYGVPKLFNRLFKEVLIQNRMEFVLPITPFLNHTRSSIQQGGFLIPGDINIPFEENFHGYDSRFLRDNVVKLLVPKSERQIALTDLHYMNLNRVSLFPGIDGFAQSLRNYTQVIDWEIHHP